mmetsp:Transcript_19520/g.32538  ORF Transcript_19520/g.32538 Transcript_19520/m.32538 type:complete len:429 (-) Transcript_19520:146-1432(-)
MDSRDELDRHIASISLQLRVLDGLKEAIVRLEEEKAVLKKTITAYQKSMCTGGGGSLSSEDGFRKHSSLSVNSTVSCGLRSKPKQAGVNNASQTDSSHGIERKPTEVFPCRGNICKVDPPRSPSLRLIVTAPEQVQSNHITVGDMVQSNQTGVPKECAAGGGPVVPLTGNISTRSFCRRVLAYHKLHTGPVVSEVEQYGVAGTSDALQGSIVDSKFRTGPRNSPCTANVLQGCADDSNIQTTNVSLMTCHDKEAGNQSLRKCRTAVSRTSSWANEGRVNDSNVALMNCDDGDTGDEPLNNCMTGSKKQLCAGSHSQPHTPMPPARSVSVFLFCMFVLIESGKLVYWLGSTYLTRWTVVKTLSACLHVRTGILRWLDVHIHETCNHQIRTTTRIPCSLRIARRFESCLQIAGGPLRYVSRFVCSHYYTT